MEVCLDTLVWRFLSLDTSAWLAEELTRSRNYHAFVRRGRNCVAQCNRGTRFRVYSIENKIIHACFNPGIYRGARGRARVGEREKGKERFAWIMPRRRYHPRRQMTCNPHLLSLFLSPFPPLPLSLFLSATSGRLMAPRQCELYVIQAQHKCAADR